jgi:DNA gyrase inhibitor GyrI
METTQTMENLNKAHETLSKLKDSDVRIIYVPPMTVAALHCVLSDGNEQKDYRANMHIFVKFVRETELLKIKPDVRGMEAYNFSLSKEDLKAEHYVRAILERTKDFESWVSIPDDMEVKAPLTKKTFEGGLYAAHLIRDGLAEGVEDTRFLAEWVNASEKYEFDYERPSFIELLNFYNIASNYEDDKRWDGYQGDLLLPIKRIAE